MDPWSVLFRIVILLGSATLFGLVVQRLGQNALIGYLLAGVLLGPQGLGLVESGATVQVLAELGVALLLFTIGLEFSLHQLRALGSAIAMLGVLQIVVTTALAAGAARLAGLGQTQAWIVGIAVAMSSTSVVLRLITERSELDSAYGRSALGILLLQDLAIIPSMLLISTLAEARGGTESLLRLGTSLAKGLAVVAAIYAAIRWLFPGVLVRAAAQKNREIPILVAITTCIGCSWASHAAGLSPVLGAFAAGILLAESPFAGQVRADVVPLRAAFLTLFFSSIGMFAAVPDVKELGLLAGLVAAILGLKTAVIAILSVLVRRSLVTAVRTGLALAQIGEFSFVLLEIGFRHGLVQPELFRLLLSATVVTLLLTPLLLDTSGRIAQFAAQIAARFGLSLPPRVAFPGEARKDHVIVVGYGPAGQQVVQQLRRHGAGVLVVELNPAVHAAAAEGIPVQLGDATQAEILEHARPQEARALVVTVPDPHAAALIIHQVRKLAPDTPVITRARYHVYEQRLSEAGSDRVVSEEVVVGERLAAETLATLEIPPRS